VGRAKAPCRPAEDASALSAGTNALLRLGATPLTRVEDVLEAFGLEPAVSTPPEVGATARLVLDRLTDAPAGIDELVRSTGLPAAELAGALTELELAGLAAGSDGIYRARPTPHLGDVTVPNSNR
jgi:DNA processing protein